MEINVHTYYDEFMNTIDNHAKVFTKLIFALLKVTVVFLMKRIKICSFCYSHSYISYLNPAEYYLY